MHLVEESGGNVCTVTIEKLSILSNTYILTKYHMQKYVHSLQHLNLGSNIYFLKGLEWKV